MPELPDVEGFRGVLAECAGGRTVRGVRVYDDGVLHGVGARQLGARLRGRAFAAPERRGKWLLAPTDGPTVLLHFGMTGGLVCADAGEEVHPHDRVVFTFDGDRQLRYRDQRKLKGLWLASSDDAVRAVLGDQGPDAARVSRAGFEEVLAGRRGGAKAVLTDQSAVAGLGNLLADEILWRARVHPRARVGTLSRSERGRLYDDMRRTVDSAVRVGRVPERDSWLTGHRDEPSGHCPRCGARLRRGRVAGRGTVWCPRCQRDAS